MFNSLSPFLWHPCDKPNLTSDFENSKNSIRVESYIFGFWYLCEVQNSFEFADITPSTIKILQIKDSIKIRKNGIAQYWVGQFSSNFCTRLSIWLGFRILKRFFSETRFSDLPYFLWVDFSLRRSVTISSFTILKSAWPEDFKMVCHYPDRIFWG